MKNRVAQFGVFVALALIFSYVETLVPVFFVVPGMKLGLANLVTVIALYKLGGKEALWVLTVRVLFAGLLFGNLFSILYAMAGGALSFAVMLTAKKSGKFSVIGVSIAGGAFHNVGQLIVAVLVVETYSVTYYLPVLLVAGEVTGFLIGVLSDRMLKTLKKINL